jgi:hypothetical protein
MWAAVLPALMDPDNDLATFNRSGGIRNQNLYFFSWAATITAYFIMFNCARHCWLNNKNQNQCAIIDESLWMRAGLVMASFVQVVSAVRLYEDGDCDDADLEICDRITGALVLGAISSVISLGWLATRFVVKKGCHSIADAVIVGWLLALWTFGAAYLTFDEEQSPAVAQGNLYFSTWSGWILLVFLAVKSVQTLWKSKSVTHTETVDVQDDRATVEKELPQVPDMDVETHATHDEKLFEAEA